MTLFRKRICNLFPAALLICALVAQMCPTYALAATDKTAEPEGFYWTENWRAQVFKDTPRPEAASTKIELVVAKNEYEPAQIVLRNTSAFTITGVTFSDMTTGENSGNNIASSNLTYKFLDYWYTPRNSLGVSESNLIRKAPGEFPEFLSNDPSRKVEADTTQSIWITLYIPKDTATGTYSGTVSVQTTAGDMVVPISAEVNNVTLPNSDEAKFTFAFWQHLYKCFSKPNLDLISREYKIETGSDEYWALMEKYAQFLQKNRFNSLMVNLPDLLVDGGTTIDANGKYTFNFSLFDKFIQVFIDAGAVKVLEGSHLYEVFTNRIEYLAKKADGSLERSRMTLYDTEGAPTAAMNYLEQMVPALKKHLDEKGWTSMWMWHIHDEPGSGVLEEYKKTVSFIKKNWENANIGDAMFYSAVPDLTGYVDTWIPMSSGYAGHTDVFDARAKDGDSVWMYTSADPQANYLNRHIDTYLSNMELLGWYSNKMGLTGYLHWGLMAWGVWRPYPNDSYYFDQNGDCFSILPDAERMDITSSIRVDSAREASEDYELLAILRENGGEDYANSLTDDIIGTMTDYSRDIPRIAQRRADLVRAAAGNTPTVLPRKVSYWSFDENSGTTAGDAWEGKNAGTLSGGTSWAASGKKDGAVTFADTTGKVQINLPDITTNWTVSMWVKKGTNKDPFASVMSSSSNGNQLSLEVNNQNKVGFTRQGAGDYTFDYILPNEIWTQVAWVRDRTGTSFYANGQLVGRVNQSIDLPMGSLGGFVGSLDEVKVYSVALNAAEIAELYNGFYTASTTFTTANTKDISAILDGNLTTSWATPRGATFPNYITIDLGTPTAVSRVALFTAYGKGQGITNIDIEYKRGNDEWTPVIQNYGIIWSLNSATVERRDVSFKTVTAEQIRLKVNSANIEWGNIALNELTISQDDILISSSGVTATCGNQNSESESASKVLDGNEKTIWHTSWSGTDRQNMWIDFHFDTITTVSSLRYLPRSDNSSNGNITKYLLKASIDNGQTYFNIAEGKLLDEAGWKSIKFQRQDVTNLRLYALESVGNYATAAEISFYTTEDIESVTPREDVISINSGETKKLWVDIFPAYLQNEKVTYVSSDTDIVTVDENGLITGIAGGETTVLAKVQNRTAEFHITVTGEPPLGNAKAPAISEQPVGATYTRGASAKAIKIEAEVSGGGTLTYQWYMSGKGDGSGGTVISGATESSYTPETVNLGTTYYYCIATNTKPEATGPIKTAGTKSEVAKIVVKYDETVTVSTTFSTMNGKNLSNILDGNSATSWSTPGSGVVFPNSITIDYITPTTINNITLVIGAGPGQGITKLDVEYENSSSDWIAVVTDQEIDWLTENGMQSRDISFNAITTSKIRLIVKEANLQWGNIAINDLLTTFEHREILIDAETPIITVQPSGGTYTQGSTPIVLEVTASVNDGGTLSYLWYKSGREDGNDAEPIDDATESNYMPPTDTLGTKYYYCIVTNTNQSATGSNKTATAKSTTAAITVSASPSHTHTLTHHAAVDATCTLAGNTEYWHCADCGKYFSNYTGATETTQAATVVSALGHDYGEWNVTKAATCTVEGEKTRVCSRDASHKETEVISKLEHSYNETWAKDSTNHWHECTVCHIEKSDMAEHTPGAAATESAPQICTVCEYVITPAIGHSHTYEEDWSYTETNHWHKCTGCEEKADEGTHSGGTATCTAKAVCETCGQSYGALVEHTYTWSNNDTQHWKMCSVCETEEPATRANHVWELNTESSTETEKHYVCLCGASKVDTDTPPELDITTLESAIAAAKSAKHDISVNDGRPSDVSSGTKFVSKAVMDALDAAVETAEAALETVASVDDVAAAVEALNAAVDTFKAAIQTGTYTAPSTGGSTSNTTSKTEKNPDGSTTTTVTNKATGTITETTKKPDGTVAVVETKKDGTVTEKVTAADGTKSETVKKPDGALSATVERKDGVKLESTTTAEGKTTATVAVPDKTDKVIVTIPTPAKPDAGMVAVIVNADGSKTVVKTSVATDDGLKVTLSEGAKLEIIDNSKAFDDIGTDYWAANAVQFAASRELFNGTGNESFSPSADMSRAMLITVLARLDGQDTTKGKTWYSASVDWAKEQGLSDGAALDSAISREQLAVMLYRYAGSPEVGNIDMDEFKDANGISAWANDAMLWCVKTGILNGSGNELNPTDVASRAEVATILMRFVENLNFLK